MTDYVENRAWSDSFQQQVFDILHRNSRHVIRFEVADREQDTRQGIDYVVQTTTGQIAVRLRRSHIQFRDLTIRAKSAGGGRTELDKMLEGEFEATAYLYGWVDDSGSIDEWALIDIQGVIASGMLDDLEIRMNPDGETGFVAISIERLDEAGLIYNRRMADARLAREQMAARFDNAFRGFGA